MYVKICAIPLCCMCTPQEIFLQDLLILKTVSPQKKSGHKFAFFLIVSFSSLTSLSSSLFISTSSRFYLFLCSFSFLSPSLYSLRVCDAFVCCFSCCKYCVCCECSCCVLLCVCVSFLLALCLPSVSLLTSVSLLMSSRMSQFLLSLFIVSCSITVTMSSRPAGSLCTHGSDLL